MQNRCLVLVKFVQIKSSESDKLITVTKRIMKFN